VSRIAVQMGKALNRVRQIWRDLGVPESHILPGNAKDNFWGEGLERQPLRRG
jgi:alanyl-tRNA synthetase